MDARSSPLLLLLLFNFLSGVEGWEISRFLRYTDLGPTIERARTWSRRIQGDNNILYTTFRQNPQRILDGRTHILYCLHQMNRNLKRQSSARTSPLPPLPPTTLAAKTTCTTLQLYY